MLRAHHAFALKTVIAKLRWEQTNNQYIRGEDAWHYYNRMINKCENELRDVEEAQKGLDRFPNCFAPVAFPKPHGPPSKEQFEESLKAGKEKKKADNEQLDKRFPFIKQLFIGPLTKLQARKDEVLREQLLEGDFDDVSQLLPSENMRMLMDGQQRKPTAQRKPYMQLRFEKEQAKVAAELAANLADNAPPKKVVPRPKFGPLTRSQYYASLPKFGPETRSDALLPLQRAQRHDIMNWLRCPWSTYDDDVEELFEQLAKLAVKKVAKIEREERIGPKTREEAIEDGEYEER
ncbi:hypothetical protein P7C73_g5811, partial [Tremellales sp. Uapishka_1]